MRPPTVPHEPRDECDEHDVRRRDQRDTDGSVQRPAVGSGFRCNEVEQAAREQDEEPECKPAAAQTAIAQISVKRERSGGSCVHAPFTAEIPRS